MVSFVDKWSSSFLTLRRATDLIVCTHANQPLQDVMFELFTKNWGYGYVTNYDDFEFLSTQWSAVVASAYDTEDFVETV